MIKPIDPKTKAISEYIKLDPNVNFLIPEYQRAYSWGIDQCDKLWQDICNYIDGDNQDSYFFGTVIISCENDDKELKLIDGQQRTTTFLLLYKALLIHINNAILSMQAKDPGKAKDPDSDDLYRGLISRRKKIISILYQIDEDEVKQSPNDSDKDYYSHPIQIINKSNNQYHYDDLSIILKSFDFNEASENVHADKKKKKDESKYTKLFLNFKYFYNKISELGQSELNSFAKTFINKCELIVIKSWNIEQAIEMFNSLNSDGLPLSDSDIISAKLYANAKKDNLDEEYNKYWREIKEITDDLEKNRILNLDSLLTQYMYYIRAFRKETLTDSNTVDVTTPGLRKYFTRELISDPITTCKDLLKLASMWNKISSFPCVQVLSKFNDNYKLFLGSYLFRFDYNDIKESDIEKVVLSLLRIFIIMEVVDVGYSSSLFKTFLFKINMLFTDSTISQETIIEEFNNHIKNNWEYDIIIENVKEYEKNSLVFVNEYLFAKDKNLDFNLNYSYDVEHIMPQSGKNKLEIQRDAKLLDATEFKEYVNKLGNKIILEQEINRGIQDEWFRSKISNTIIEKKGYLNSNYPIAKKLVEQYKNVDHPYWTRDDISIYTDKAAKRICNFIFLR